LGQKGADNPAENVSHSGSCHPRVACAIDGHRVVGIADDAVASFQQDGTPEALHSFANRSEAIGLYFSNASV
jgi:hypothetical protein